VVTVLACTRMPRGPLRYRVRSLVVDGPLRPLAAPVFEQLVASELAIARRVDRPAPDTSLDGELTALIKTFERPRVVERLVASIRRRYPTLPIVVVDDSRAPRELPSVETIVLPFDSGVSAGRQAGLDRVTTPYVLLLDDDFVFYGGTDLARALGRLAAQPRIDILGGQLIDLPLLRRRKPPLGQIFRTTAEPLVPIGTRIDGLPVCDKVANFYIARTDSLRRVGWNAVLRRLDHADFFTRALGVLVTVFDDELRCFHAQTPFDRAYMAHRLDVARDRAILAARWSERSAAPHIR
jgi:glycosyltransferase involved in cell wall biosynthesis